MAGETWRCPSACLGCGCGEACDATRPLPHSDGHHPNPMSFLLPSITPHLSSYHPPPPPPPPPQGRTVWRDVGLTAICFRLMAKFLDYNFLATVTASTAHTMGDYRALEAAGTPAPTPAPTPATTPRATSPTVSPRRGRGGSRARK